MVQFLMVGMMIIFISMLSGGSGLVGSIASAVLPFFAVIGVALMTLHFWVLTLNGPNQNLIGGNRPVNGVAKGVANGVANQSQAFEPGIAFGGFLNGILYYGGQLLYGVMAVAARTIAWPIPWGGGGARLAGGRGPEIVQLPDDAPRQPAAPPVQGAVPAAPQGAPVPQGAPAPQGAPPVPQPAPPAVPAPVAQPAVAARGLCLLPRPSTFES